MARNPRLYPDLPARGLGAQKLDIPAFAYCHETVTEVRKTGRNLVHEICECKTWNVICVDPEHLRDKTWREITAYDVYCTNIVYGCVDEAHLINEWGIGFRPDFRHIGGLFRGRLPSSTSILALPATLQPVRLYALIHTLRATIASQRETARLGRNTKQRATRRKKTRYDSESEDDLEEDESERSDEHEEPSSEEETAHKHPHSSPIPPPPKRARRVLEEVNNEERPTPRPAKKAGRAGLQSAAQNFAPVSGTRLTK
ncbi:hypothetical protein DFH09DRAFT_1324080 [Mycena vulgaris]|nr:hypothetical protein DFH09DRAFT_1324080 [Mycena vulgaris]